MQAWGTQSRFQMRDTALEPTKSGVIGLLCAALGWARGHDLTRLNQLIMGVRVDRPGRLMMDYQTALEIATSDLTGTKTGVSRRYFLADGCFLVGLEGTDLDWLIELHNRLREPVWPLYLGRKSYVPTLPVWMHDGLREGQTLEEALKKFDWLDRVTSDVRRPSELRFVIESNDGFVQIPDWAQTFDVKKRFYLPRRVDVKFLPSPDQRYKEAA
jgi:CRISPR system Cascade subunit CasD